MEIPLCRKMFPAICRSGGDLSILTIASWLANPLDIVVLTSIARYLLLSIPCRVSGAMAVQQAASQQMPDLDPGVNGTH